MSRRPRAFTLVELLVVISIIGMLMSLLLPAVTAAREAARKAECANNMSQVGKAFMAYDTRRGELPGLVNSLKSSNGAAQPVSWATMLLPDLGRNDLWDRLREGQPDGSWVLATELGSLQILICPSDVQTTDFPTQSFVVNSGYTDVREEKELRDFKENGVFHIPFDLPKGRFAGKSPGKVSLDYVARHDGVATTIMLSENVQAGSPVDLERENNGWVLSAELVGDSIVWVDNNTWSSVDSGDASTQQRINWNREFDRGDPGFIPVSPEFARPSSNHPGGVNVLFCDGHLEFLREDINYVVYQQLMTTYGRKAKIPPNGTNPLQVLLDYTLSEKDYK